MKSSVNQGCKRSLSVILLVSLLISLLAMGVSAASIPSSKITTSPATGYTKAEDVAYKYSGDYIANWGARGEDCVFLSTKAQSYYTGSYTFDTLSGKSGGSGQNNAPDSDLYKALASMMKSKHKTQTSYEDVKKLLKYTDCIKNDAAHISCFYTGKTVSGTWDGGKTWNREHTWPNSKGLGGNDENDIMMLRPESPNDNTSRGNTAYGQGGSYFDPGVSVRGDCARIFLYVYVRWGNTNGNGKYSTWGSNGVIQNAETLLRWMEEDPVDTWEMGRNDAVQSITGVRNVFVDYPEYAWLLFGQDVPVGVTTPSHNDGTSANPNPNPGPDPTTDPNAKYATAVSTPGSGNTVYIYFESEGVALGSDPSGSHMSAVTTELSGGKLAVTEEMLALTVSKDGNGYLTLRSPDGKYLTSAPTGNGLSLESSQSEYSLWVVDSQGLKNVNAQYNGSKSQYLEYYNGYITTYSYKASSAGKYTVSFYTLETASTPCRHSNTELRDKKDATCTGVGYTGDSYCLDCGAILELGEDIPALSHSEKLTGKVDATCTTSGYTGDVYCSVCGTKLRSGETVAKLAHSDRNGDKKCDNCGTALSCAHEHEEIRDDKAATCSSVGYTGDSYCLDCGAILELGEDIPALSHSEKLEGKTDATCTASGYTGDVYCSVCGVKIRSGQTIPATGHTEETRNAKKPSCSEAGYTGDVYCSVCDTKLRSGQTVDKSAHSDRNDDKKCDNCGTALNCAHEHEEIRDDKAATCSSVGYTGDSYCLDCGAILELGEDIPALSHSEKLEGKTDATCTASGYTGDVYCSVCGVKIRSGQTIPATGHTEQTRNAKKPSCSEAGYTGDVYCSVCDVKVSSGKTIPATAHKEETRNAKRPSCIEVGYTGDVYCSVCDTKLRSGETVEKSNHLDSNSDKECDTCGAKLNCAHENKQVCDDTAATCTTAGYTGDNCCLDCGAILSRGEEIPATGHQDADGNGQCDTCSTELNCTHENKEVRNATNATCADTGYTGDSYCLDCDTLLEPGTEVPALSHSGKLEGKADATCGKEGYTGDTVCEACGEVLEKGKTVPATGEHTFGDWLNTVDGQQKRICSVCGEKELRDKEAPEPGKTSVWVYIGAGVLGLAALGGAGYGTSLLIKKKKAVKK